MESNRVNGRFSTKFGKFLAFTPWIEVSPISVFNKNNKNKLATHSAATMWKLNPCFQMISLFAFLLLILIYYMTTTVPEFKFHRLLRIYNAEGEAEQKQDRPRTILFWNDFFGEKNWYLPNDTLGLAHFRNVFKCAEYRCVLTSNHEYLPSIDMYDALIFHTARPFPLVNSIPTVRRPEQLYIFTTMECPPQTNHRLHNETNFYNLTMTYRLDSDVLLSYNNIVETDTYTVVAPSVNPSWKKPPTKWNDKDVWSLWPGKTKMAAWFVSNCDAKSPREQLAAALQKYIDVDIYGRCGTLTCDRSQGDKCDRMLDEQYKFYFAFENTLCIDYVTEKAFNALKRHVIPVVFGGANYSRFLPPHSYINVEDFDNVEELASYLKYVASDPAVYMRYFWYRAHYRLSPHSQYCKLCELLNSPSTKYKTQIYVNINRWWRKSCRVKTHIRI